MAKKNTLRTPRLKRLRQSEQFGSYQEVPVLSQGELSALSRLPNDRKLGAIIAKRAICAAFTAEQWHELNTCVVDLLADLRHICDTDGLDFGALDRHAYAHYCAEVYGEHAYLPALGGE